MAMPGSPVDETGTLVREGGTFVLELQRVPVDYVAKRVRIRGVLIDAARVSVDGVAAA